ncbi:MULTISPECIES: methyl-coenzyme M reductase glutamine C-methyltransferase [Methanobacterium]|uniref:Methyl-coenzyme M reductase glutamine C-methyltransferase n=1 Tax=Methanobacterium veterum TaxID=408577 RepID=A0A9E4ZZC7_9EURY|nr:MULTISPECIES: methyl-coenzyme M reductase glutamine C-methyltransferase [Methanobacterium]MCZ3366173.1 methyl-coenzyme M reductase glutamine C-methyltransferase [Methanobacterium veterum]MCZ3371599.1 methyl-coenzyme M reductase glutamine C-methyltransferase [Methanobacterium veterum]
MAKSIKITVLTPEFYNYGAMLIAGVLKDAGYNVNIQKGFEGIIDADVVLISLHSTIHLLKYREEIEKIKSFKIVGGPVSNSPELVFKYLSVDAVIIGEGEGSTLKILENLEADNHEADQLNKIEGIAFKKGNKIIKTKKTTSSPMIRPLPLIPEDISSENIRGANVYIETHRGCPGNCGFCQVPCFFGRDVRSRTLDDIIIEVKEFLKKGAKRIAISGGTGSLYGSKKFKITDEYAFTELLKEISSLTGPQNLTIPDIRIDMMNDEILEAVKNYTNGWIFFGIESGSDRMLRKMKKGIKVDDIKDAIEAARKHNIKIAGSFIVGYPGESEDDFEATVELADELMLDDYFVSIAEPIPGTPLAEDIIKTPLNENLLFIKSDKYKNYELSIAEERCLNLMLDSYVFRSIPVAMTDNLFKTLLEETKSQGNHIRTVTEMILNGE